MITILCFCLLVAVQAKAQQSVADVLQQVAANNKTLQAAAQYREARKLEYKTGLNPEDPLIEYDYFNGQPAEAGNQKEFAVTQRIDFPTAYGRKRRVANLQEAQADYQYAQQRQNILLEAQQTALQLIYLNKQATELERRYQDVEALYRRFQKSTRAGEGNMLDENKARVRLLNIRTTLQANKARRRVLEEKLTELNGGQSIALPDTAFAAMTSVPAFEVLDSLIEVSDPRLKMMEQQAKVQEEKVKLAKALALPKLEGGYRYQSILGQTFQGVHAGISIPLWERRNTVNTQQAYSQYAQAQLEAELVSHRQEVRQTYEEYQVLQESLRNYQELMARPENLRLLEKALRLGEISATEYFMELSFYYDTYDKYLELEAEAQQKAAELLRYTL
ncbi:outer membrane protein TolC [Pontibacter aydingkolensis]|uniref:TolC family protein n=1 Tax=Pontibacter aydingkolensis TaxID=1911536 RepID=A0ABS7CX08_9BACT|nr:TolC family protein [Pontibacter aydingkolensis]MBW7468379.1 TolC family protein [Pontibacter aydingkolensis]